MIRNFSIMLVFVLALSCSKENNTNPSNGDDNGNNDDNNTDELSLDFEFIHYTESNSDLVSSEINTLKLAKNGEVLISTNDGISIIDINGNWTNLTTDNNKIHDSNVLSTDVDSEGNYWYMCDYSGMGYWNGSENEFWFYHKVGMRDFLFRDFIIDNNNYIFSATSDSGVVRIDIEDMEVSEDDLLVTNRKNNDMFPWSTVTEITHDQKTNNTWLGSFQSKLFEDQIIRVNGSFFYPVYGAEINLRVKLVNQLFVDNNFNLWVSAFSGLAKYDGESWESWTNFEIVENPDVEGGLMDKKGNIWAYIEDLGFVIKLKGESEWQLLKDLNSSLPNFEFSEMILDYNNDILIATAESGLIKIIL